MLAEEKTKLEEEYRLADSAFNEEVGLRLQFEHKINELHGVHRELLLKHDRLLSEFDVMKCDLIAKKGELKREKDIVEFQRVNEC